MTRIAGAQIPVTNNIYDNIKTIKTALDWAHENKVDFLLTPEGALSGYLNSFDALRELKLDDHIRQVTQYACERGVNLILGTEYIKPIDSGMVKCSQVHYYNDVGIKIADYDKQMPIPAEMAYIGQGPEEPVHIEGLGVNGPYNFKAGTFICNDMWGDEVGDESDAQKMKEFADVNIWMASRYNIPIVTVDNCYKNDGSFYDGPTSSTSGIMQKGKWLAKANPTGTDYFYYDFNF
jgi:predicted amidohydrolase